MSDAFNTKIRHGLHWNHLDFAALHNFVILSFTHSSRLFCLILENC
jgi:hypothetical protein